MSNTNTQAFKKTPWNTPLEVRHSAWYFRFGQHGKPTGDFKPAYFFLEKIEGLTIFTQAWFFTAAVFALAYVGSPFPPEPTNGIGQGLRGPVSFLFIFTHYYFVYLCANYLVNVLFMVPWKDLSYPMVGPVNSMANLHRQGLNYLGFAAIAAFDSLTQSLHVWAIGLEGLFLVYLHYGQPAFGFTPWKTSYNKRLEKENEIAQQVAASASAVPQRAAQPAPAPQPTEEDVTYQVPVVARRPNLRFESISGMNDIKEKLYPPAQALMANLAPGAEAPRNGILLFGEPGNGKTIFAEALAGELNVSFINLTYGEISSQWLGNMPKVISNVFTYAKRNAPCVLLLDEIDSFIKSRDLPSTNTEDLKITNTILTEIVGLRGHKVVLVGATNYLANLDSAAIREGRFDYKIEITPPDETARIGLINAGIKKYAIGLDVDQAQALSVAKRWNGFSVARLMAICKALPDVTKSNCKTHVGLNEWMAALRAVQGRRGKLPADAKSLKELVLADETKDAIHLVASRLKDVARIESLGGTLPTGVLFHGPSGTGKTAAARALAKEAGWAFLSVAGPDLLSDRTKIDKLFAEAKDIRPTLIFIDEADDVLRNRQFSNTPDVVNKLLTLMEGAEDRVKDVVWVAATNNPDQIEPALLRSGRFTEKVLFTTPPQDLVPRHIAQWLKNRGVAFDADLDAAEAAELLHGQTIADIEGVLQYALNRAISTTSGHTKPTISLTNVHHALRIVLVHSN